MKWIVVVIVAVMMLAGCFLPKTQYELEMEKMEREAEGFRAAIKQDSIKRAEMAVSDSIFDAGWRAIQDGTMAEQDSITRSKWAYWADKDPVKDSINAVEDSIYRAERAQYGGWLEGLTGHGTYVPKAWFVCNQKTEKLYRVSEEQFEECRKEGPDWRIQVYDYETSWSDFYRTWFTTECFVLMKDRTYVPIVKDKLERKEWVE